ncbi:Nucleoside-diphosphate kinase [Alicyclobacillus hesperidum URH17-3-68]|uniref:Nucleoside diphosphate kinase n=1 Tax=Alicyclobacillus hesperidum TaxID=89784 RepID=A0A1H2XT58_9BACL|nr:nucleoside-diphosphate kinase [Alicyclobacillus hesperidum]EJY55007.1 Nucleoside-diphosphate kinase [Alicyclobacillus hesperidum URH17-3-68]GLV12621.1 nucleoside-diphosphate kinase [Alicyclobacillus hesperidum]SDW95985.1 nucleoside diphosphate kinase [Alicyclobacillus hesperidum]
MAVEKTFVMVKPDGVQRGLIGEVLGRFERKGLKLVAAKLMSVPQSLAEQHYAEHRERPFFGELVSFITSSPVFAMVLEGENAISVARTLMGKTNPAESAPGTIRGDYGLTIGMNIVHGSDSPESAAREIELWFSEGTVSYDKAVDVWLA